MDEVKISRTTKAAATRRRMLDAAYELFCERGFRATTLAAVADRADVAVQTIYFTFGTKDALLQEVFDRTVLGQNSVPPPFQPWYRRASIESDPRRAVTLVVEGVAVILARVAPMLPVFHAVSGDAAGDVFRNAERLRWDGMRDLAEQVLMTKVGVRPQLDPAWVAGLLFVLLGPESYRSFVLEAGWTRRQWTSWTVDALVRDLYAA